MYLNSVNNYEADWMNGYRSSKNIASISWGSNKIYFKAIGMMSYHFSCRDF